MPLFSFDRLGFRRHARRFAADDLRVDMGGKRCVITGANAGLGFATAEALAALGADLALVCRNQERGERAADRLRATAGVGNVEVVLLDVSDLGAIDEAASELAKAPIDVLIHNAGVLPKERVETSDGLELTFATHVAGPHRLTHRLRDALVAAEGARVIFVSSGGMLTRALHLDDPQWTKRAYDGVNAYAETKRAQVVLAERWAEELAASGVTVNAMHPGWADTGGVRDSLPRFHRLTKAVLRTPAEGADTIVWLAASPAAAGRSGEFFFDRRSVRTDWLPFTRVSDDERASLWNTCEGLS